MSKFWQLFSFFYILKYKLLSCMILFGRKFALCLFSHFTSEELTSLGNWDWIQFEELKCLHTKELISFLASKLATFWFLADSKWAPSLAHLTSSFFLFWSTLPPRELHVLQYSKHNNQLKSIWKVVAQIARSAIISILYVEFLFLFLFLILWLMRIIFRANSLSWRTFKADKNWGENFPFFKH